MNEEFKNHLLTYLDDKLVNEILMSLDQKAKSCAVLNIRKMSDKKFKSLFPNVIPHPIVKHAYIFDKDEYQLGKNIYHDLGCFYIQEPSAAVPAFLLHANENELVLDLCAAPGGKSVQTSMLMNNTGLIISNDSSMPRAKAILENAERLGLGNLAIISKDLTENCALFNGKFDKVILDAPCSGSGMFRKNEAVKEDWSYAKVLKFQEIQKQLIINAYSYLKEGGTLCYSTCSFSKEEDEDVINHLISHTDAEIQIIEDNPLFYKSSYGFGIHLFPNLFPGEGHYIALIKKPGVLKTTNNSKTKNEPWTKLIQKHEQYNYSFHYDKVLFLSTMEFDLKNIPVIRYGVKVGELYHDEIGFDHHYSHFVDSFENTFALTTDEAISYLKGQSINKSIKKGYVLLTYDGIPLDFGKSDGRIIKNRYPKYLRRN